MAARIVRATTRLIEHRPEPRDLIERLEALTGDLVSAGLQPNAWPVISEASKASPQLARGIWAWICEHPDALIASQGGAALDQLRRADQPVDDLITAGWESDELPLRRAIAAYLESGAWFEDPTAAELRVLEAALTEDDPFLRSSMQTTLLRLENVDAKLASELALRNTPTTGHDADLSFATVEDHVATLSAEQLDRLVHQLIAVDELEHFGTKVVSKLARLDLNRWIDVWQGRLERGRDERRGDGRRVTAVPNHDYHVDLLLDVDSAQRVSALEHLLSIGPALDACGNRELGKLYWRAGVPDFDDLKDEPQPLDPTRVSEAIHTFGAWATASQSDGEAVEDVLFGLPWQIVFDHPDWVDQLLKATDGERRQQIMSGIHAAAFGSVFGSSRMAHIHDAATKILASVTRGSATADLYGSIQRAAKRHQEDDRRRDEELDAGWE
jgi:hypothetical protein